MAKRKSKKKNRKALKGFVWLLIIVIVAVGGFLFGKDALEGNTDNVVSGNEVQFHFIDVGQADAALIRTAQGDILIDAGTNASEEALKAYLDNLGVTELKYAVFTHPHEDHIGGADMILTTYQVDCVILPDVTQNSKTYTRMMDAIEERNIDVIEATPGKTFTVGEVKCTILAPIGTAYTGLNDYSVVLRADYGDTSVLYTGDAEVGSEGEMVERYRLTGELDCDILKVGHHGAKTSSSAAFLELVTPVDAVISCGEGNTYGHPTGEALAALAKVNATVHRTDLEGSIVFVSTGGEPTKK